MQLAAKKKKKPVTTPLQDDVDPLAGQVLVRAIFLNEKRVSECLIPTIFFVGVPAWCEMTGIVKAWVTSHTRPLINIEAPRQG
jgi:hypothetical protein